MSNYEKRVIISRNEIKKELILDCGHSMPLHMCPTGQLGNVVDCAICSAQKSTSITTEHDKHHFKSGASSSGYKPPYECLTLNFLKRSALRMQLGLHYGKHNWKKGLRDKDFILDRLNHALEHLVKATAEIDAGIAYSDDDLAAVVVNCMFAMEYQDTNGLGLGPYNPIAEEGQQSQAPALDKKSDK